MKKIIFILIALTLIVGCGKAKEIEQQPIEPQELITQNTNDDVVKEQTIDGFKLTNITLTTYNELSKLIFTITNIQEKQYIKLIDIIAKDENGNVLYNFKTYVDKTLEKDENVKATCNIEGNLTNVYSLEYKISK